MNLEKDIRISDKKVDDSWKDLIEREKRGGGTDSPQASEKSRSGEKAARETSAPFLNFLNSLALQTMIHLGEIPHPQSREIEKNLEAAREMIDILVALKAKTEGNLSPQEASFFTTVLAELQLKFVHSS